MRYVNKLDLILDCLPQSTDRKVMITPEMTQACCNGGRTGRIKRAATRAFVCYFLLIGNAMSSDIISEISRLRETNKAADVDVTFVVKRYIYPNMSKIDLEKYLLQFNFKLYYIGASQDKLVAVNDKFNGVDRFGFNDEVRLIITLKDDIVADVSGLLIYRAL